jgi:hypothetical protein
MRRSRENVKELIKQNDGDFVVDIQANKSISDRKTLSKVSAVDMGVNAFFFLRLIFLYFSIYLFFIKCMENHTKIEKIRNFKYLHCIKCMSVIVTLQTLKYNLLINKGFFEYLGFREI